MALYSDDNRAIPAVPVFSLYGTTGMENLAPAGFTRPFSRVGIMGASGTGVDIVDSLLESDIPVTLFELAREPLDLATASMRSAYQNAVSDGELTVAQRDRRVAMLAATVNLHHLKDCDVIVEALCASAAVKDGMLRRLNELAKPGAILIACVIDADANAEVNRIASLMRFPENVLGMRRSNGTGAGPWELVPAKATSECALATADWVVRKLRRSPAPVTTQRFLLNSSR
jgi:3-hydroxyacyl-CoA dehydrogenase